MIATHPSDRFLAGELNRERSANRLAERLRHYFDEHPQVSREEFLVEAIQREMDSRASEDQQLRRQNALGERRGEIRRDDDRQPLTAEDVRIHAWLVERLALLHRERSGWWSQARRFLRRWWLSFRFA